MDGFGWVAYDCDEDFCRLVVENGSDAFLEFETQGPDGGDYDGDIKGCEGGIFEHRCSFGEEVVGEYVDDDFETFEDGKREEEC